MDIETIISLTLLGVTLFGAGLVCWFNARQALCFFIGCLGAVAGSVGLLFLFTLAAGPNVGDAWAAVLIIPLPGMAVGFWLGWWLAHIKLISKYFGVNLSAASRRLIAVVLMLPAILILLKLLGESGVIPAFEI